MRGAAYSIGRDENESAATHRTTAPAPDNDNVNPSPHESSPNATAPSLLASINRDPRFRLVSSWVSLATTPLVLIAFAGFAISISSWCWLLVAGVLVSIPFNIRDVVRHAHAFRS